MLFGQHLGLGFAKAHGPAFAAALHAVHEVNPHADQQRDRQKRHQEGLETGLLLGARFDGDVVVDQKLGQLGIAGFDRQIVGTIRLAESHLLTIQCHISDIPILYGGDEFGIADFVVLQRPAGPAEQVEQRQHKQHQDNPEGEVTNISQGNSPKFTWPRASPATQGAPVRATTILR